jgi:hypothetical protein
LLRKSYCRLYVKSSQFGQESLWQHLKKDANSSLLLSLGELNAALTKIKCCSGGAGRQRQRPQATESADNFYLTEDYSAATGLPFDTTGLRRGEDAGFTLSHSGRLPGVICLGN